MEDKLEYKLIYRFCLFGLFIISLNAFIETITLYLINKSSAEMTRDWAGTIITTLALLMLISGIIIKTILIKIKSDVLDVSLLEKIILIGLLFISFIKVFLAYHILIFILMLFWLIIKKSSIRFFTNVTDDVQQGVEYNLDEKSLFSILSKSLLVIAVSNELLSMSINYFFPIRYVYENFESNNSGLPDYTYLKAILITYLIYVCLAYIFQKNITKSTSVNRSNTVNFLFYLPSLYVFLFYFPFHLYMFLTADVGKISFILLLLCLIALLLIIQKVNFKQKYNSYELIKFSLTIYSVFYIVYLLWNLITIDFQFYSDIKFYIIQFVIVLLIIIFRNRVSFHILKEN